jgi:hypothetical protein
MTADHDVAQDACTPELDNEGEPEDCSDNGTALRAHWTQEVRSDIAEIIVLQCRSEAPHQHMNTCSGAIRVGRRVACPVIDCRSPGYS